MTAVIVGLALLLVVLVVVRQRHASRFTPTRGVAGASPPPTDTTKGAP